MKYIEKVAVDYFIANVPTFLIAEMISNYLAVVVNTFFKFLFCHIAKLLKIGQKSNEKPHRLLGEAGGGGCRVQSSPWRLMLARYSEQSAKRSSAICSAAVRVAAKMLDNRQVEKSVK